MRTLFRATIALSVLCLPVLACSSDNTTTDAGLNTQQVCPTTILQATAAPDQEGTSSKCHVENYQCTVGFPCGYFQQQATCTCQTQADGSQQFVCTLNSDPSHPTIDQGSVSDPLCASPPNGAVCSLCKTLDAGTPDPCPTDKTKADGTSCKNAGQVCTYSTTCTSQPPPVDTCQCVGTVSGDAGLVWSCDLNQCP